MTLPSFARFVVVGAGVHGLSTAAHLAEEGADVVVLEKNRVGAGASGISGGIVRNFYLSAAMNEIVRQSVELFELDPQLFGFRQVGYVAAVPEAQAAELERIAGQHAEIGYASTLVRGAGAAEGHMRGLFPDWRAQGVTAVLHEQRSGWANAGTTVAALAGLARSAGAQIAEGVEVLGFDTAADVVRCVETSRGPIGCDAVALAPGPWARDLWRGLGLPRELDVAGESRPAFHYWQVREGDYTHTAGALDRLAPVVHLDADIPLAAADGRELLPAPWGVDFRPGLGQGMACGGLPLWLDPDCELDPDGPSHPELGSTDRSFDEAMEAALAWSLGRFAAPGTWTASSYAAQTGFTPDSYPVVGWVRGNAYAVLDSNHGFKMLALGKLAASELLGAEEPALAAFRLGRFAAAELHPTSTSPYPWN